MCDDMGGGSDIGSDVSSDTGMDTSVDTGEGLGGDASCDVDDFAEDAPADFLNDFEVEEDDLSVSLEDSPNTVPLSELEDMTIDPIPDTQDSPYFSEGQVISEDIGLPEFSDSQEENVEASEIPEDVAQEEAAEAIEVPEDAPQELTESQEIRMADLDEGYQAVADMSLESMEDILQSDELTHEEKIEQLQNLRDYTAEQAEEYHSYQQDILDNPEEGETGYARSRHR
jgi:hypothetical protein